MICSRGSVLAGRVAVWFDGEPREQLLAGLDVVAAFDHVLVSQIPPDAVTASLSGLAPDISPQDVAIQVNRAAGTRRRSSCCPGGPAQATRSARWTWAPTTT